MLLVLRAGRHGWGVEGIGLLKDFLLLVLAGYRLVWSNTYEGERVRDVFIITAF